jgi:ribosomal protein L11 methyltransferase
VTEPESTYWALHIEVPKHWSEEAAGWLVVHGASGVEEIDPTNPFSTPPQTALKAKDSCLLIASYEGYPIDSNTREALVLDTRHLLGSLNPDLTGCSIKAHRQEYDDWAESWKKHFEPICVGHSLWICAPWHTRTPPDKREPLIIEPAMAFGTGQHPTTVLCLEILEELMNSAQPAKTLLDVGTGSGILSLATLRWGLTHATGIDIDVHALDNAHMNRQLNNVSTEDLVLTDTPIDELSATYDIVVANILAPVLLDKQRSITKCLRPGSQLLLSGLLVEQYEEVTTAYLQKEGQKLTVDLQLVDKRTQGSWAAVLLRASPLVSSR